MPPLSFPTSHSLPPIEELRSYEATSLFVERANAVEQELGRVRTIDGGPRTIDVDIVAISDEVIDTATLTVPHPRAHERAFVLVPWLEVDPQASLVGHGSVCRIVDQMDVSGVVRTDEKVTLP